MPEKLLSTKGLCPPGLAGLPWPAGIWSHADRQWCYTDRAAYGEVCTRGRCQTVGEPPIVNAPRQGLLPVEEAIRAYRTALENLPQQEASSSSKVMCVLTARHAVAQALANHQPLAPALLGCLVELDQDLRSRAATINT